MGAVEVVVPDFLDERLLQGIGVLCQEGVALGEDLAGPLLHGLSRPPLWYDEVHEGALLAVDHGRRVGGEVCVQGHPVADAAESEGQVFSLDGQVALSDHLVLSLEVDQAVVHLVLRRQVLAWEEDLALVDKLKVALLAGLLDDDIAHVVLIAERPRSALEVRVGLLGIGVRNARGGIWRNVVHKNSHGVGALVAELQEMGADLHHLSNVEVRRDRQLLGEQHAVHELYRRQHRRALLVGGDLVHRGDKAGGTRGEDAIQRAVAVLGVVPHSALLLLLLVHEVQEVELELAGWWEGRDAHAHHLPALGDRVGRGVGGQLLHNLEVDFVAELRFLKSLLENVLGERGRELHLLVSHVAQQRLVHLDGKLAVLGVQLGEGSRDLRLLPLEHTLLELALLQEDAFGKVVRRPEPGVVLERVLLLLCFLVPLLGGLVRVLISSLLDRLVSGLALLLVGGVELLEPLAEVDHHVHAHLELTGLREGCHDLLAVRTWIGGGGFQHALDLELLVESSVEHVDLHHVGAALVLVHKLLVLIELGCQPLDITRGDPTWGRGLHVQGLLRGQQLLDHVHILRQLVSELGG
mmetsp:Transcript_3305/g.9598  ORF Transcript_3305/g.9598 Transcript_3305/m.9598 type:complete len:580 (+) Transcript_3305:806-2545(+)